MAPFRTVRFLTALTLLVPAVPVVTVLVPAVGDVPPAYATDPTPRAETSRAGSRAGEGRERPGRVDVDAEPSKVGADDPMDTATATAPGTDTGPGSGRDPGSDTVPTYQEHARPTGGPDAPQDSGTHDSPRSGVAQPDSVKGPTVRALPLGSGLILIGLGLGMAFLGLRVRRP